MRRVVVAVTATAALLIVAPGVSAQAGGAEQSLQAICEHVDGGEWIAANLVCLKGTDPSVSVAAAQVCNNTIGELLSFGIVFPGQPDTFGWICGRT